MSFSADWLALREPFDHRARATDLAERFATALPEGPRLLELGGGTGSGVRWLAPWLKGEAQWWVLDHDEALLAHLDPNLATPRVGDVRRIEGWPEALDGVQLQALLDLTDLGFLQALAAEVARRSIPILAALSVDGRVTWTPSHPADDAVQAAFRLHQLTDRGFGASVGPYAGAIFADLLRTRGFDVTVREADWIVPSDAGDLLRTMVDGTAEAATQMAPQGVDVGQWRTDRLADLTGSRLTLRVGHLDVLGCPAPR